jgi:hypothetical protein
VVDKKEGRNNGRGGCGYGGRGGCGRGQNYIFLPNTPNKVMYANLVSNVFDYGQKSAADLMRTSWENLVQYVTPIMGKA